MFACLFPIHLSRLVQPRPVRIHADKTPARGMYLALFGEGTKRWTCKVCWKRPSLTLTFPGFLDLLMHGTFSLPIKRLPCCTCVASIHHFQTWPVGTVICLKGWIPPQFPVDVSQWNPNRHPFQSDRLIGRLETTVATVSSPRSFFLGRDEPGGFQETGPHRYLHRLTEISSKRSRCTADRDLGGSRSIS